MGSSSYWDKWNKLEDWVKKNLHSRDDQEILGLPPRENNYTDSFEKLFNRKRSSDENISGGNGNIRINSRDYNYSKDTGELVGYQPKKGMRLGNKLMLGAGISILAAYGLSQIQYEKKSNRGTGRFNHTNR